MTSTRAKRLTQEERRTKSRRAVLDSASRLFGEKGYADTSLEDIAQDCGLTIRPIYHYFESKKALFAAVNDEMEQRILDTMSVGEQGAVLSNNWRAYLSLCDDPAFRQIVLIDSPNVLGRERWATSPVSKKARALLYNERKESREDRYHALVINAMVIGALTEVALWIAEADDVELAKRSAETAMSKLMLALQS